MDPNVKSECDEWFEKMCKFLDVDRNMLLKEIDEITKYKNEPNCMYNQMKARDAQKAYTKEAARQRINDIINNLNGKRKQPQPPKLQLTVDVDKFYKEFSKWIVDLAYKEWETRIKTSNAGKLNIDFNSNEIFIDNNEYVFRYGKKFVTYETVLSALDKDDMIKAIKKVLLERVGIEGDKAAVSIIPIKKTGYKTAYDLSVYIEVKLI
jgi:hypothetical protein